MEQTNLRQAKAIVEVEGVLAEKNLKEEVVDGRGVIKGNLVIQTSDTDSITFNVYTNQYKSDGKGSYTNEESTVYKSTKTVMEEYKSIAEFGKENADYVKVSDKFGQIKPNTYFDINGKQHDVVKYQSNFFTRIAPVEECKAEFTLEMYIKSIAPEMVKDDNNDLVESGRALVKGWMPTYSGIEPITLVAPADIADGIMNGFEVGQTVEFFGSCVNSKKTVIVEIPVRVGKPKKEEHTEYVRELIITGASEPFEAEEGARSFYSTEAINKAVVERELKLQEAEAKAKTNSSKPMTTSKKPVASGRSLPNF